MYEISNQPPPLDPYDLFASDTVLREAVAREQAGWAQAELGVLGKRLGDPETIALGFAANRNPPDLRAFDRYGHRVDEVDFHPAWHRLMEIAVGAGLHASPWEKPRPGAHVARAAGTYMLTQIESGVYCPIAMTYGSVPTLAAERSAARATGSRGCLRATRTTCASCRRPQKSVAALIGMAMTENQGGSDSAHYDTHCRAQPDAPARAFSAQRHKWFMSAPMCDAFLVLAQARRGPALLRAALDRRTASATRIQIRCGSRTSSVSAPTPPSEVEFVAAARRANRRRGPGHLTIIEMSNGTRLDCAIGSAALMPPGGGAGRSITRMHRIAFQRIASRPTADDERVGRPRAGERGRDRAGDAVGARLRRGGPGRRGVAAGRDPGGEILDLQARAGASRRRGDGGLGRQRLRRRNACCRASIARRR